MTQLKYFKIIYFFVLIAYLIFNYVHFHKWFNPSNAQDTEVKGISNEPFEITNAKIIEEGVRKVKDIKYVNDSDDSKKLDLYLPSSMLKDQKYPVILYIHGGAWLEGNKDYFRDYDFIRNGFVVASIDYRLSNEDLFPAQIHDVKAGLRWLKKNASKYNMDVKNVGVYGESAGAHLAALMGTTADNEKMNGDVGLNLDQDVKVKAVVSEYGLPNLETIAEQCETDTTCKNDYYSNESIISKLLGCTYKNCGEKLEFASPSHYVSTDDAAFLHFQGKKDDIVPSEQSVEFNKSLIESNLYSEISVNADAMHVDANFRKDYYLDMLNFFDWQLKEYKYPFCEHNITEKQIYKDVYEDKEYFEAVNQLACINAFYAIADQNFKPDSKIKRSEIASVVNIAFGIDNNTDCDKFDDIDEMNRSFNFIQTLKCAGISKGVSNNEFKPDGEMNATQLGNLIAKAKNMDISEVSKKIKKLDIENPDDSLSRGQAAQIINLFI